MKTTVQYVEYLTTPWNKFHDMHKEIPIIVRLNIEYPNDAPRPAQEQLDEAFSDFGFTFLPRRKHDTEVTVQLNYDPEEKVFTSDSDASSPEWSEELDAVALSKDGWM